MAKKETDEKLEREYVIPLRKKYQHVVRYKKTPKAIKTIKEFLARHMKIENRDLSKIKIDKYLNQFMWGRGIRNPPAKIKVKAVKKGENVIVELVDYPAKLKFNKEREEKQGREALASIEKKKSLMQKAKESMQTPKTEEDEEKKKESEEKQKASAEATKEMEKAQAKKAKHSESGKTKEPKRQQRKALAK